MNDHCLSRHANVYEQFGPLPGDSRCMSESGNMHLT